MSCPDIKKELSASGAQLSLRTSEHLATCPDCSRWANEVAHFDQIWAQTRPAEPDPTQFSHVWNHVCLSVPATAAQPSNETSTAPFTDWRHRIRFGLIISGLAAAAVLLVAGLPPMFRPGAGKPAAQPGGSEIPLVVENFESEPGQTLFIQISGPNVIAENRPTTDISETITVAAELDILNFMESQSQGSL